jgi:hypothetical protein
MTLSMGALLHARIALLGALLIGVSACWTRSERFEVVDHSGRSASVVLIADKRTQKPTHGGWFGTDWYNVETVLAVTSGNDRFGWILENVASSYRQDAKAKAARNRNYDLVFTTDGGGLLISSDNGKTWLFAYVEPSSPFFFPQFLLPGSAKGGGSADLARQTIKAKFGVLELEPSPFLQDGGRLDLHSEELALLAEQGSQSTMAQVWKFMDRPDALADAELAAGGVRYLRRDWTRSAAGVAWLKRALSRQPAVRTEVLHIPHGPEALAALALALEATEPQPAGVLLQQALSRLTAADSSDAQREQRKWLAIAIAGAVARAPDHARSEVAALEALIKRFGKERTAAVRAPALYAVRALAHIDGLEVDGILTRLAEPSPEIRAKLARQYVTVDRSDTIDFNRPLERSPETLEIVSGELHDWAKAALKWRTDRRIGPKR